MSDSDNQASRRRLPQPFRFLVGLITRLLSGLIVSAILMSGLYVYLTTDPEFKQTVLSAVMGKLQDLCKPVSESGVDYRSMNYREFDLAAIAKTMLSSATPEEKQTQMQAISQRFAASNQDAIKAAMIDHGVSESDAEVALNFQLTVARYNMPMAIAPFAYAIKDKPNANRFFTSFHHNNIGANGAGAIPLLKDALRGKDPVIAAAARQSLLLINTPEAQAVLSAPAP